MATIQIRDVSDEDYQALRDAAKQEGKSLQAYMKEQAADLARRSRKKTSFAAARAAMARNTGAGVTTEGMLEALSEIRGPWPGHADGEDRHGRA